MTKEGGGIVADEYEYEENYRVLCIAVVTQVIEEYKEALRNNVEHRIKYYERWLKSDWCFLLSGMDGEYIIEGVRKAVQAEKADRGNDGKGTKKVYKTAYKESEHESEKYWKEKEGI